VEGEAGMRADYLQYHHDRLLALMRTLAHEERPAVLAQQCVRLGETDLSDAEIDLIGHRVGAQLAELDPVPLSRHDGHVLADHLDVRGAVLRGRVRDFYHSAITLGALRPWATPQ
jgi:hypothetical protein